MQLTDSKKPLIGLITAITLVIANMVGTGVFTSLGFQVVNIHSGFVILFLWLMGGLIALCGAFVYGELGAALPRSGGEYHLLSKIYSPAIGFLAGWISMTVGFAAPIAAAAMAMGKYVSRTLFHFNHFTLPEQALFAQVIAILVVIVVTLVHLLHLRIISSFQNFFTGLKISLILVLIIAGFTVATPQSIDFYPHWQDIDVIFSQPFAVSLVFVMYAYSGWNAAVYIVDEIKQPGRYLPIALFLGTTIVILLYISLNSVFLYTTPIEAMAMKEEVGYIAAEHIFGSRGGIIMGLLIAIGLISTLSSMIWAGPRVAKVIGEDVKLLQFLARHNSNNMPVTALLAQLLIVLILIISSSFEAIMYYIGFTLSLSVFLTVLGVFVLRIKQPNLYRPYRTWGYPITPLFFLLTTTWMLIYVIKDKPMESLAGLGTVGIGLIIYGINKKLVESELI